MIGDVRPSFDKEYLIRLHGELSVFHELLARRTIPHSYDAPGCGQVADLMEFIEDLTREQPV
jgi:hypothetical protein